MSKAELEDILRANKDACDETNTEDRERYSAFREARAGNDDTLKRLYRNYYGGLINAKQLKEVLKMHRNGSGIQEITSFMVKCYKR